MSFISILKGIGRTLLAGERILSASGLGYAIPGWGAIDAIFRGPLEAIIRAEVSIPGDKQGALRLTTVVADFENGLQFTQSILAIDGKKLVYDGGALQEAIAAQVSAFNAMAKVKASFKVVSL